MLCYCILGFKKNSWFLQDGIVNLENLSKKTKRESSRSTTKWKGGNTRLEYRLGRGVQPPFFKLLTEQLKNDDADETDENGLLALSLPLQAG